MIPEEFEENMSVSSSFLAHMKRLMRSAFDPLPRSLSIRSLAILVTMFVGGIGLSVHEYLESGKVSRGSCAARTISEKTSLPRRTGECSPAPAGFRLDSEPASAQSATTAERPIESEATPTAAPGLWVPDTQSTGS